MAAGPNLKPIFGSGVIAWTRLFGTGPDHPKKLKAIKAINPRRISPSAQTRFKLEG
jgi:hypothetical protein